jgi:hypothetical protein
MLHEHFIVHGGSWGHIEITLGLSVFAFAFSFVLAAARHKPTKGICRSAVEWPYPSFFPTPKPIPTPQLASFRSQLDSDGRTGSRRLLKTRASVLKCCIA